jgi:hypothetical protein
LGGLWVRRDVNRGLAAAEKWINFSRCVQKKGKKAEKKKTEEIGG